MAVSYLCGSHVLTRSASLAWYVGGRRLTLSISAPERPPRLGRLASLYLSLRPGLELDFDWLLPTDLGGVFGVDLVEPGVEGRTRCETDERGEDGAAEVTERECLCEWARAWD